MHLHSLLIQTRWAFCNKAFEALNLRFENTVSQLQRRLSMDIDLCLAVDSWACTQLIMPLLFDDSNSWMQAASKREEVPREIMGTFSSQRYHYNRDFCAYIMSPYFPNSFSEMSNVLLSNWMYDSEETVLPNPTTSLIIPNEIIRGDLPPAVAVHHIIPWIRLIRSQQVKPYWDPLESIGLQLAGSTVFQSHCFKVLTPYFKYLNATSLLTQLSKHQRFSLFQGNLYLAGPAGLMNHACSRHSNVNLDINVMEVRCNAFEIVPGEALRITYASEDDMLEHRGFSCNMCT